MTPEAGAAPKPRSPGFPRPLLYGLGAIVLAGVLAVWWRIDSARNFEARAKAELPVLIAQLESHDSYSSSRAAHQIGYFGPRAREAIPALVRAIENPDYHTRTGAASSLARIGPEVIPPLLPILAGGAPGSRRAVLQVVHDLGPLAVEAVPGILRAMQDPDLQLANEASGALSALGEAGLPAVLGNLKDAGPLFRQQLIDTIHPSRVKAASVLPPLIRLLDEDKELRVQVTILDVLGRFKEQAAPAAPAAARALESKDALVRADAAELLGSIGSAAFEPTLAACSHARSEVRERALHALAAIGRQAKTGRVVQVLSDALADPDWTIRRGGVSGLGWIGRPARSALPGVLKVVQDSHPEVRLTAVFALERFEEVTPDVLAAIEKACSDPDTSVRESAENVRARLSGKK